MLVSSTTTGLPQLAFSKDNISAILNDIQLFLEKQESLPWNILLKIMQYKGLLGPGDAKAEALQPRLKAHGPIDWNGAISQCFGFYIDVWRKRMEKQVYLISASLDKSILSTLDRMQYALQRSLSPDNRSLSIC